MIWRLAVAAEVVIGLLTFLLQIPQKKKDQIMLEKLLLHWGEFTIGNEFKRHKECNDQIDIPFRTKAFTPLTSKRQS